MKNKLIALTFAFGLGIAGSAVASKGLNKAFVVEKGEENKFLARYGLSRDTSSRQRFLDSGDQMKEVILQARLEGNDRMPLDSRLKRSTEEKLSALFRKEQENRRAHMRGEVRDQ